MGLQKSTAKFIVVFVMRKKEDTILYVTDALEWGMTSIPY